MPYTFEEVGTAELKVGDRIRYGGLILRLTEEMTGDIFDYGIYSRPRGTRRFKTRCLLHETVAVSESTWNFPIEGSDYTTFLRVIGEGE